MGSVVIDFADLRQIERDHAETVGDLRERIADYRRERDEAGVERCRLEAEVRRLQSAYDTAMAALRVYQNEAIASFAVSEGVT